LTNELFIDMLTHFGVEEGETLVDIFHFVDTHLAVIRLGKLLARDDLEQFEKFLAIGEVYKQVLYLHARLYY